MKKKDNNNQKVASKEKGKESKLLYDVDEKPPIGKWIILALQHLFAMFGATILVPILVNQRAGAEVLSIPVALFASGVGTLIYIFCTKGRSPVYLGSSFAFIAPMATAFLATGKASVFTALIGIGLIYVIFSILIKLFGISWVNRLLPPVVVGPMIMIIGLGLAPNAVAQAGLAGGSITWETALVVLVTFAVTSFAAVKAKGFLKVIPFLIGIVAGYITACCVGMVDFSVVSDAKFFATPDFYIPFLDYTLDFGALLSILPIALVTMAEHIGDHKVLSQIVGRDLIEDPGLDRTLLGDGIATAVSGILGGPVNTTYGENTSVVGMSKVASVWVIGLAAIFAMIIAFLGKGTALISTIPDAVLGSVSILLYGFISVNGLIILIENQVDFTKARNVVIAATMLVLGLGGAAVSIAIGEASLTLSGMSLAAIVGIVLNLILGKEE